MNWKKIINHAILFTALGIVVQFILVPILLMWGNYYLSLDNISELRTGYFKKLSELLSLGYRPILPIAIIAAILDLLILSIRWVAKKIGRKKFIIGLLAVISLIPIDVVLEHPDFFGLEIIFPVETKILYATTEFQNSLSTEEKEAIYRLILSPAYPCYVLDSLSNTAGRGELIRGINFKIPIDAGIKEQFTKRWNGGDHRVKLVSKISDLYSERNGRVKGNHSILIFSPIKRVGKSIYIGYTWCGARGGNGAILQIEKINGQWKVVGDLLSWIS